MIRLLVNLLVLIINVLYRDRPYSCFYILETIAKVPDFAYISPLHLYETYRHQTQLKSQASPQIAIDYYRDGDLYHMFDEFPTAKL